MSYNYITIFDYFNLRRIKILLFIILITSNFIALSQRYNRFNSKGERTGKWIIYIDESKKIKSFEGKFKHDLPKGKCFYYNNDGLLDRKEIDRFKKLRTTFYYVNGRVRLKGKARIKVLPDKIHYYFYGKWKAYNDSGVLTKYYYYEKGKLVKTIYLNENNNTNDSLIKALNSIDKEFANHNSLLTDSVNTNTKNNIKYEYYKHLLYYQDSLSFDKIEQILDNYGYPSRSMVGDASDIPFYILSFAPIHIKEKYIELLKTAARSGDISKKSLAYFIDKIKVSKNEKQIYGTQKYLDKEKLIYILYPIEDGSNVNKRRLEMGLDVLEPY